MKKAMVLATTAVVIMMLTGVSFAGEKAPQKVADLAKRWRSTGATRSL